MNVLDKIGLVIGLDTTVFRAQIKTVRDDIGRTAQQFTQAGKSMQDVGRSLSTKVTLPIIGMGAAVLKTGADFESSMNMVSAVTGATGESFTKLSDLAKELGSTTQFSASEAADAMYFLASAGFDTEQIMGTLPGVLQLASAAQMDLATAADITSNILSGYGMEVEELGRVNDVMVKTFQLSNTNLQQLGEAFKYAGPLATAAGVEFEEAAAILGMMGNAGIQASMAGTSLRGALTQLLNPTDKVKEVMDALGLQVRDSAGEMVPMVDIIRQLEESGASAEQMMALFGQRAGPAMQAVVSQGSEALAKLVGELENSGGTAERVAAVQMEGMRGAFLALKSAAEGLAIALFESGVGEYFEDLAAKITDFTRNVSEMDPATLKLIASIAGVAAIVGPTILVLGALISAIGKITAGITALNLALVATPAGLAILASAVVALGVVALKSAVENRQLNDEIAAMDEHARTTEGSVLHLSETIDELAVAADETTQAFARMAEGVHDFGRSTIHWPATMTSRLKILDGMAHKVGNTFGDTGDAGSDAFNQLASGAEEAADGVRGVADQQKTLKERMDELAKDMPDFYAPMERSYQKLFDLHERHPFRISFEDGRDPNRLAKEYERLAPVFERAAQRIEAEDGMRKAVVKAYEAAEDLMDSFRSMQAPIRQVTDAIRDLGPAFQPAADAIDAFVEGIANGKTLLDSFDDAVGAFTEGNWAYFMDTAISVLKDIFSSGGSANKRIDMIKMALDSNTRAVELNTDAMIKTITSGIGGGQLTGLLGLITEGIAQMREGEVDPETGRPLFDFFDFLRQGLADLGISWDQFMAFADQMGIDLSGGIPALEQFGKIIEGLIGKQLSDFASAWDNLLQQLDLRGVDAEGQIGSMIDFLKGQVGPELGALLDTLLGADPKEAGNIIADIIQNLREGGSLIGELGDIAIDEFIQALLSLFGIFGDIDIPEDDDPGSDVEDAQRKFEGDEVNAAEEEAHKIAEQRWQAQEAAWAADRIAYDAMIREITDLKMSVTDLISTNRQGFEDVAVAARSA